MALSKDNKSNNIINSPSSPTEFQLELVSADEKARAKMKLQSLRVKGSMYTHIVQFKKLVEMADMTVTEAYIFFLISLPAKWKQEFHKKFPAGAPSADIGMSVVYEHARTLVLTMRLTTDENTPSSHKSKKNINVKRGNSVSSGHSSRLAGGKNRSRQEKKPNSNIMEYFSRGLSWRKFTSRSNTEPHHSEKKLRRVDGQRDIHDIK